MDPWSYPLVKLRGKTCSRGLLSDRFAGQGIHRPTGVEEGYRVAILAVGGAVFLTPRRAAACTPAWSPALCRAVFNSVGNHLPQGRRGSLKRSVAGGPGEPRAGGEWSSPARGPGSGCRRVCGCDTGWGGGTPADQGLVGVAPRKGVAGAEPVVCQPLGETPDGQTGSRQAERRPRGQRDAAWTIKPLSVSFPPVGSVGFQ